MDTKLKSIFSNILKKESNLCLLWFLSLQCIARDAALRGLCHECPDMMSVMTQLSTVILPAHHVTLLNTTQPPISLAFLPQSKIMLLCKQ